MGYKLKNISYLLAKSDNNYNKPVTFKIENNLRITEYKILPYQEIIFDSKLLPIEIKKMEMLGMIQAIPVTSNYIDSINNPVVVKKEKVEKKKPVVKEIKKQEPIVEDSEDINILSEEPKKRKSSKE
jgi:hypothetical protein